MQQQAAAAAEAIVIVYVVVGWGWREREEGRGEVIVPRILYVLVHRQVLCVKLASSTVSFCGKHVAFLLFIL